MIQRIQTLWLAVIIIIFAGTFYFPYATYTFPLNQNNTQLKESCTYGMTPRTNTIQEKVIKGPDATKAKPAYELKLIIPAAIVALLALIAIFSFKNRKMQLRLVAVGAIILRIDFVYEWFFHIDSQAEIISSMYNISKTLVKVDYNTISFCLPILQLLLFILAERAIRRDDRLVSSSDRLR